MHIKPETMRSFLFLFIVSLLNCSFSIQGESPAKSQNTVQFDHSDYTIELPKNWSLDESGTMGTHFTCLSQVTSESDDFRENLNVVSENLKGADISINEYTDISLGNISKVLTDFNLISKKKTIIGEKSAYVIKYQGTSGVYHLVFEQYLIIHNDWAYIITYTGEENEFSRFHPIASKAAESFRLK